MARLERLRWAVVLALLATPGPCLAHERWVDHEIREDFDRSLFEEISPENFIPAVLALASLFILAFGASHPRIIALSDAVTERLRRGRDWTPALVAVPLGLTFLLSGLRRELFAPDLILSGSLLAGGFRWAELAVGCLLVAGLASRAAGWAAVLLFAGAMAALPFEIFDGERVDAWHAFNYLHVAAIGLYLAFRGRPRMGIDTLLGQRLEEPPARRTRGMGLMRILVGLTLVVLGLQKWAIPELPMGVVQNYRATVFQPFEDLLAITPEGFVFAAGLVEWSVGMLVLSGIFVRPVAAVLAVLFATTAGIFTVDLVGHLPLFGVVAALAIEGGGDWQLPVILARVRRRRGRST